MLKKYNLLFPQYPIRQEPETDENRYRLELPEPSSMELVESTKSMSSAHSGSSSSSSGNSSESNLEESGHSSSGEDGSDSERDSQSDGSSDSEESESDSDDDSESEHSGSDPEDEDTSTLRKFCGDAKLSAYFGKMVQCGYRSSADFVDLSESDLDALCEKLGMSFKDGRAFKKVVVKTKEALYGQRDGDEMERNYRGISPLSPLAMRQEERAAWYEDMVCVTLCCLQIFLPFELGQCVDKVEVSECQDGSET